MSNNDLKVLGLEGTEQLIKEVKSLVDDSEPWAYLNQNTLYLNRADSFAQNGTTLEVKYNVD